MAKKPETQQAGDAGRQEKTREQYAFEKSCKLLKDWWEEYECGGKKEDLHRQDRALGLMNRYVKDIESAKFDVEPATQELVDKVKKLKLHTPEEKAPAKENGDQKAKVEQA